MKINVYYGGRGLLDDPTLYVLQKMEGVLKEIRVEISHYNIYEHKNEIATLPQTIREADGIILATTVEWMGIGGYMQQFLDACWLYGDKEKIKELYMLPVVMSTTYGEREGEVTLLNAWEILGGLPCAGICGYVDDLSNFQENKEYSLIVEKKAENLYRTISQHLRSLPSSNQAIKRTVLRTAQLNLTPQESDQLSEYVSDDNYVNQQKQDLAELTSMFKGMMGEESKKGEPFVEELTQHFVPQDGFAASYSIVIDGMEEPLCIKAEGAQISIFYGDLPNADVHAKISRENLQAIVEERMTFQRAFMTGEMTAKGNFKTLRMLDQIFKFH